MRKLILTFLAISPIVLIGQTFKPDGISISYFGEMVTHPGLMLSFDYNLKSWTKAKKKGDKTILKSLKLEPGLGFYYHKRYQTGVLLNTELQFNRQSPKGNFFGYGFGLGYLRTFIPNTFEVSEGGKVEQTTAGHNYFAPGIFFTLGKDLSIKRNIPLCWFIKPNIIMALPNFPTTVTYFVLELGITYKLKLNS